MQNHRNCLAEFIPELLETLKTESGQCLSDIRSGLLSRQASFNNTISEIRKLRIDIVKYLDHKESELVTLAQKIFSEDEKAIKQSITHCEAVESEINQLTANEETPKTGRNEMFVKSRIMSLQDQIEKCSTQCNKFFYNPTPYTFIQDQVWRSLITSRTCLGVIESDRVKFSDTEILKVQNFNVKTMQDKSACWISGITLLENNLLLFVDSMNNAVKHINMRNYHIHNSIELVSRPWDITAVEKDTAAITLPDYEEVHTITCTENEIDVTSKFRVQGKCYGICSIKDRLVVTFVDPPKVELMSRKGIVLKKFELDPRGKFMFRMPEYVTASQSEGASVIYVSDWRNNTLIKMLEDGTVLFTYKEKGLVPGGIVVSSYGETLTCNREKNRLHLIDTDGKKGWKRLKKTDGLNMPYAICYSHSDNRLFVASCLQDTVAVYQLVLPTNPSCNNSIASS